MKTPVAVTLIIMGALLIITPAISDYLWERNVVALLSHGFTSVNLDGKMGDMYRIGCWLTGTVMVALAVFRSLSSASEPARRETPAINAA